MTLSPRNQEELFKAVQKRFKDWGSEQASGYVHGAADGLELNEPRRIYPRRFVKENCDPYAIGYIYGFIDAYGTDTLTAEWSQGLELLHKHEYRWWTK